MHTNVMHDNAIALMIHHCLEAAVVALLIVQFSNRATSLIGRSFNRRKTARGQQLAACVNGEISPPAALKRAQVSVLLTFSSLTLSQARDAIAAPILRLLSNGCCN